MSTDFKRNVKLKTARAKATSTYLDKEEDLDLEFSQAVAMEKLKRANNGEEVEPITKSEMFRIFLDQNVEAIKAEGYTREQFNLPPDTRKK